MPIKSCTTKDGGKGFKFGDSGHCYSKREDAIKQMRAEYYNGYKGKGELTPSQKIEVELKVNAERKRLEEEFGKDQD